MVSSRSFKPRARAQTLLAAAFGAAALLAMADAASAAPTLTWNLANTAACIQTTGAVGGSTCHPDGFSGDPDGSSADNGNVYTFTPTSGSGNLIASSYHSTSLTNPTTLGSASFLGIYSGYGLGVENDAPPQHALDNNNGFDFLVLKLPVAQNQVTITLSSFGTSEFMNATVFYGTPTGGLSGITSVSGFANVNLTSGATNLLNSGFQEYNTPTAGAVNGTTTFSVTDTTGTFQYVIIAASLSDPSNGTYDYFKVNSVTDALVNVPEPTSWTIVAFGLIGVAILRRRKSA